MSAVANHALRQMRAGRLAIGLGLRQARTVDIAQIAKTAGFDWLFIDCEHNSMDTDTAAQIAAASLAVGITPVVRVAGKEHYHASRMLDNGAQGIIVPHVETGDEARRVADACRFPPLGHRSMGGGLQQLGFAAVPGIDALLVGTNDLCFELGIPGQFDDPRVAEAYRRVIAACRKHRKFPGMGGMYTPELLRRHIGMGVQLVLAGSDFSLLMQAASAQATLVRGLAPAG